MKCPLTKRAFCARAISAALFLMIAGAGLQAQITFNNFSSTAGLTLNGSAAQFGNVLRLTPATQGQAGSAWFNNTQSVQQGFTTKFDFQVNGGGDGFAFVIQNAPSPTTALGAGAGGLGYGQGGNPSGAPGNGIQNSLAVEFDTFANDWDPDANHVAVQSCSSTTVQNGPPTVPNGSNNQFHVDVDENFEPVIEGTPAFTSCTLSANGGQALQSLTGVLPVGQGIADGSPHTVVIDYNPNASCGGDSCSLLTVSVDAHVLFAGPFLFDLSAQFPLPGGTATVGFTGGTGGATETADILNWTFTPHTTMTIGPLATPPGQTTVFNFGAFNFKSTPATTTSSGNSLKVTAVPVPSDSALTFGAGGQANCIVYDNTGGTCWEFDVQCTGPDCSGTYDSEFQTSYDSSAAIVKPGFLKHHSDTSSCPRTDFDTNQIDQFFQTRIDPTTKAKSGGTGSCWVATQNTSGVGNSIVNFIGFASPVSNTALNLMHPPQTVPLAFQVLDLNGNPINNLTLCTTTSCPAGTVNIQQFSSSCSVDDNTDVNPATDAPFTGGSGLQNLGNGNYQFNWKTQRGMTGCWTVSASFGDGVPHIAVFKVK